MTTLEELFGTGLENISNFPPPTIDAVVYKNYDRQKIIAKRWNFEEESWKRIAQGKMGTDSENPGDDSEVIQAAVEDSNSVLLLSGTYYVSSPIELHHYSKLLGSGIEQTVLKLSKNANCNIIQGGDLEQHQKNVMEVEIANMTIDGQKDINQSGNCIHIIAWDSKFYNLRIKNSPEVGFFRDGGSPSVDDCFIYNVRISGSRKYNLQIGSSFSAPKTTVVNCVISASEAFWNVYARGNAERFISCTIYYGGGILLDRCPKSLIDSCYIEDTNDSSKSLIGVVAKSGVDAVGIKITNNFLDLTDGNAAVVVNGDGNYIRDCIIANNTIRVLSGYTAKTGIKCIGLLENVIIEDNAFNIYGVLEQKIEAAEGVKIRNNPGFNTRGSATVTATIPITGGMVPVTVTAEQLGIDTGKINTILNVRLVKADPDVLDVYEPRYGINATGDAIGLTMISGTGTTLTYSILAEY